MAMQFTFYNKLLSFPFDFVIWQTWNIWVAISTSSWMESLLGVHSLLAVNSSKYRVHYYREMEKMSIHELLDAIEELLVNLPLGYRSILSNHGRNNIYYFSV